MASKKSADPAVDVAPVLGVDDVLCSPPAVSGAAVKCGKVMINEL